MKGFNEEESGVYRLYSIGKMSKLYDKTHIRHGKTRSYHTCSFLRKSFVYICVRWYSSYIFMFIIFSYDNFYFISAGVIYK